MSLFTYSLRALFIVAFVSLAQVAGATISVESITPASASDVCDGSFQVIANGTAGPFVVIVLGPTTFYEEGDDLDITFSDLCPGQYQVEVIDAFGCKKTISTTVRVSCNINLEERIVPSCTGNGGAIHITPLSGATPYTYEWRDAQGNILPYQSSSLTDAGPGDYTLIITDANNCISSQTFTVPEAPFTITMGISKYPCKNSINGELYATSNPLSYENNNPPYTFAWSNGNSQSNKYVTYSGPVSAGTNSVTVTDANGCQASAEISLPESEIILAANVSQPCNAKIDLSVANSTGVPSKYFFQWSNGAKTEDIDNLSPGQYCVTVTDALSSCSAILCRDINIGALTVDVKEVKSAVFKENETPQNNGSIKILVGGGTAPYTYQWSNGSTTKDISNLLPGTYTVTVTDANSCIISKEVEIKRCDADKRLTVEIGPLNVTPCDGQAGAISPKVKGGIPILFSSGSTSWYGYKYQWAGPNGFTSDKGTISNLKAEGNYCVTVTDACGNVATNCQYLTCDCPSVLFDFQVNNRCIKKNLWNLFGLFDKPSIEFGYMYGTIQSNYPMLDNIINDKDNFEFVLDWNGNKWGDADDAFIYYPYGSGNYDINGAGKIKLEFDKQDVNIIVTDFLGCQHFQTESFSEVYYTQPLPLIENISIYDPNFVGVKAQTGEKQCEACGGVCQSEPKVSKFQYLPNNTNFPCSEGGTLSTNEHGDIEIPANSFAVESVDYSSSVGTAGNGMCIYNAGCYFPFGTIDEIGEAVYVQAQKVDECAKEGITDVDYGDPRCGGPIIVQYTGDCSFRKFCRLKDSENGEILDFGIFNVPEKACVRKSNRNTFITWDVYTYCEIDGHISEKYIDNISSKGSYEECPIPPAIISGDEEISLLVENNFTLEDKELQLGKSLTDTRYSLNPEPTTNTEEITGEPFVREQTTRPTIKIYPNPFKDRLYVEYFSTEEGQVQLELLNTIGINVLRREFEVIKGANKFSLETKSDVALGVYYLRISDKNGNFSIHKVVH